MEDGALVTEDSNNDQQRQKARSLLLELLRQAKQHQPQQQQPSDDERQNDNGSGERWSAADDELPSAVDDDYLAIPHVEDVKVDSEERRRSGNTRKTQTSMHDDRQDPDATGGTKTLPTRRSRPRSSGRRSDVDTSAAGEQRSKTSTSELDKMVGGLLRRRLAAAAAASEGGGRREATADGEVEKDEDVGMELDGRPRDELMERVESNRVAEAGARDAASGSVSSSRIRPPSAASDGGRSSWRTWFGR